MKSHHRFAFIFVFCWICSWIVLSSISRLCIVNIDLVHVIYFIYVERSSSPSSITISTISFRRWNLQRSIEIAKHDSRMKWGTSEREREREIRWKGRLPIENVFLNFECWIWIYVHLMEIVPNRHFHFMSEFGVDAHEFTTNSRCSHVRVSTCEMCNCTWLATSCNFLLPFIVVFSVVALAVQNTGPAWPGGMQIICWSIGTDVVVSNFNF